MLWEFFKGCVKKAKVWTFFTLENLYEKVSDKSESDSIFMWTLWWAAKETKFEETKPHMKHFVWTLPRCIFKSSLLENTSPQEPHSKAHFLGIIPQRWHKTLLSWRPREGLRGSLNCKSLTSHQRCQLWQNVHILRPRVVIPPGLKTTLLPF